MKEKDVKFSEQEAVELVRLLNIAVKAIGLGDHIVINNAIHFKQKFVEAFEEEGGKEEKKDVAKK